MKATGIVRRIDDLGRVVIPKEIRRTLRIREGDPLEIFTDREGGVILKKYSPIGELTDFSKEYAEALQQTMGHIILIADNDAFISVSGTTKKEFIDKKVSDELEQVIENRKTVILGEDGKNVIPLYNDDDESKYSSQVISPIIAEGDVIGSVIIISKEDEKSSVSQFFHILGSVDQQRGCCDLGDDKFEITIYTSCCNVNKGIYYYTTYDNHQINAIDMHKENLNSNMLIHYPLIIEEHINFQN